MLSSVRIQFSQPYSKTGVTHVAKIAFPDRLSFPDSKETLRDRRAAPIARGHVIPSTAGLASSASSASLASSAHARSCACGRAHPRKSKFIAAECLCSRVVCELHCSVTALGVRLNYGGSADEDRSTLSHPTQAAAGHEGGKHMGDRNCASSMRLRSVSVLTVLWIRRRLGAVGP